MKSVIVGGETISVELADEEDEPDLENRHAVFLGDEARILIDEDTPPAFRWHYLGHELAHAVNRHLGVEFLLRDRFGLTEDQAEKIEEFFAAHIIPTYLDTLDRNGWIKKPRF